ncbi:MAG: ATP-binding protein [Acidobacteriota bacterium]
MQGRAFEELDVDCLRDLLEQVADSTDRGVLVFDSELRLVAWNRRSAEMGLFNSEFFQYRISLADVSLERARAGVFDPELPVQLTRRWLEAFRDDPPPAEDTLALPSGRQVKVRRVRLATGETCVTLEDVTERHDLEERLRQARRLDAVGRLAGGIAHDINNTLTVISGCLESALADLDGEGRDVRELLGTTLGASERCAELIDRLLALSRHRPQHVEVVQPERHLVEQVAMLRRLLGQTLEVELKHPPTPWCIHVDPGELANAIVNLALNARDAMPEGGRLTIEVTNLPAAGAEDPDRVGIAVTDTGHGMESQTLEAALDPFFTTKADGGTGLGLASVRDFVESSSGRIRIDSKPGAGTTVTLLFPRARRTESAFGRTVLIVEDEDGIRHLVARQLRSLGYEVLLAADSDEALRVLSTGSRPDALLADVNLPGTCDGIGVALHGRAVHPDLPVVFMSGQPDAELPRDLRRFEEIRWLRKPFHRGELALALQEVLQGSDSR